MTLKIQRRIAAEIMKCGESRVWMSPEAGEKISHAITRRDVRGLIKDKLIREIPEKKSLRLGPRARMIQKAKGRRSGAGSRKGAIGARARKKERWLKIIRPQRSLLISLKKEGKLQKSGESEVSAHTGKASGGAPQSERGSNYRTIYTQIKGGMFRSKHHLISHLEEHKLANVSLSEFEAAEKSRKDAAKKQLKEMIKRIKVARENAEQKAEIAGPAENKIIKTPEKLDSGKK